MAHDGGMSAKADQKKTSSASPLTTPCTLGALRAWLTTVDVVTPGWESHVTVTASASGLTVA
jgi:hypothetical protein